MFWFKRRPLPETPVWHLAVERQTTDTVTIKETDLSMHWTAPRETLIKLTRERSTGSVRISVCNPNRLDFGTASITTECARRVAKELDDLASGVVPT